MEKPKSDDCYDERCPVHHAGNAPYCLVMRDGWSDHHHAVATREIDELASKLAAIKSELADADYRPLPSITVHSETGD